MASWAPLAAAGKCGNGRHTNDTKSSNSVVVHFLKIKQILLDFEMIDYKCIVAAHNFFLDDYVQYSQSTSLVFKIRKGAPSVMFVTTLLQSDRSEQDLLSRVERLRF